MALSYRVERDARRRTLQARVEKGEIVIRAPRGVSDRQIRAFVMQYADQLERMAAKGQARQAAAERDGLLSGRTWRR